jgi:hypothetical protein
MTEKPCRIISAMILHLVRHDVGDPNDATPRLALGEDLHRRGDRHPGMYEV